MLKPKSSRRREAASMSRIPSNSRVIAYLPSFKTIVQRLRATSATPSSLKTGHSHMPRPTTQVVVIENAEKLQARDIRVPNPQHDVLVTPSSSLSAQLFLPSSPHPPPSFSSFNAIPSSSQTHSTGAAALLASLEPLETHNSEEMAMDDDDISYEAEDEVEEKDNVSFPGVPRDKPDGTVECVVQTVPDFLVANLLQLFPGLTLPDGHNLNVIVLSQHTVNDMTSWSSEVEEERQQLLEHFIDSAKEVCSRLNGSDYWADLIDPSSGRAYFSPYSTSTLYETDDRYRYLGGFDIIDLGCCKCIRHPYWGAFAFVGSVFTTAPLNSPAIQSIIEL